MVKMLQKPASRVDCLLAAAETQNYCYIHRTALYSIVLGCTEHVMFNRLHKDFIIASARCNSSVLRLSSLSQPAP